MMGAGILDSQEKDDLSKVPDALSGLICELSSDKQVTNKVVSMSTEMGISIFHDVSAKTVTSHRKTWEEVVDLVDEAGIFENKSKCPLIKLGVFGDKCTKNGSIRSDENLREVFGIECDYDGGEVTLEDAYSLLLKNKVEALLYTTPSHTHEKPRWRVLVPLSKGYAPSERAKFVAVINGILGGILAQESFTISQTYYYGRVKGVFYESRRVRGVPVDCLDPELTKIYPFKQVANKPKSKSQSDDLARQCILNAVTKETINDIRSALLGMKPERAENYTSWINNIEALASLKETPFAEEAYKLAHEFSKRCEEKYNPEYLDSKWEGMNPSKITYRSIFRLAQDDGWFNPRCRVDESRIDRTDAGNMALLAKITKGNLRYVPERNMWLWWDGAKWESDQHGVTSQECALKVAEYYHSKAIEFRNQAKENQLDSSERKRIEKVAESQEKWATQCRNKRAIDSMLSLAKSDKHFILAANKLDCDPWLLGVENGVVDLRTGKLREASRNEFVTRRSPLRFNPNAKTPRWLQFIKEITASPSAKPHGYSARPELANYLQRALGYTITGSTREQKMFIAFGGGANGKNVLLDTLQSIMGEYCQSIPPEALMAARYSSDAERPSPTAAMLAGARTAVSNESKNGQKLDVTLVKKHTGGGFMSARYMRENTFRFEITHKLWLMTNHKPALDHMDEALRGRLHLIPFDMRWNRPGHPERDPSLPDGDKNLLEKLKEEGEGILAWLIDGAVAYVKEGLEAPKEVVNVTQSYFQENDLLGQWIEERCGACEPNLGGFAAQLFESFKSWCEEEGHNLSPHNQISFSKALIGRGIKKHVSKEGRRYGLQIQEGDNGFNKVMDDG